MPEEKVTVSARITKEMHTFCLQEYTNMSVAINAGLDLLKDNKCLQNDEKCLQNVNNHKRDVEQLQEKIKDLQEMNKEIKELQEKRVNDLKEQINSLIEDAKNKDKTIEDLNKNIFAQANSLYNLTNTKLLPENTENKKPWWRFW